MSKCPHLLPCGDCALKVNTKCIELVSNIIKCLLKEKKIY